MDETIMHFLMLNSKIFRNTQIYLDKVLRKYDLTSGAFPYLFFLEKHEGVSQNKISKELSNDKAMSARTITKLIDLGYLFKEEDQADSRAFKLYLTEKAKVILPEIHKEIQILIGLITDGLTEEDKLVTMRSLETIFYSTQKFKE